jgi:hypothetical protein
MTNHKCYEQIYHKGHSGYCNGWNCLFVLSFSTQVRFQLILSTVIWPNRKREAGSWELWNGGMRRILA